MTVVLDTHAFVWALRAPSRLGSEARGVIADHGNEVLISPVTLYEMSAKLRLGRWPEVAPILNDINAALTSSGIQLAELTGSQALRAGRLQSDHLDPFDRMIAALALELDAPLASIDDSMDGFGVRRVW